MPGHLRSFIDSFKEYRSWNRTLISKVEGGIRLSQCQRICETSFSTWDLEWTPKDSSRKSCKNLIQNSSSLWAYSTKFPKCPCHFFPK